MKNMTEAQRRACAEQLTQLHNLYRRRLAWSDPRRLEARRLPPRRDVATTLCGVCGGRVPVGFAECACGAAVPPAAGKPSTSTRTAPQRSIRPKIEYR